MMTVSEAAKLIDKVGLLHESRGMRFEVRVLDVKSVYGGIRYQVKPCNGDGVAWVDARSVTDLRTDLFGGVTKFTADELYVGALWHEYCDPFIGVIGFNGKEVREQLEMLAEEEKERIMGDWDGFGEEPDINIMSSGVHLERGDDFAHFVEDQSRIDEYLEDLNTQGYVVV